MRGWSEVEEVLGGRLSSWCFSLIMVPKQLAGKLSICLKQLKQGNTRGTRGKWVRHGT